MDTDTKAAEVLYRAILWVDASNRDLMIDSLREEFGEDIAGQVEDMFTAHAINGNE